MLRPENKRADEQLEKIIMVKINYNLRNLFISMAMNKFTSSKTREHFEKLIEENLKNHLGYELEDLTRK